MASQLKTVAELSEHFGVGVNKMRAVIAANKIKPVVISATGKDRDRQRYRTSDLGQYFETPEGN
jgi:hypothetical protein